MGAMKSLAYDYAIELASPDKNYEVINDIFAEIVNGDIEIPQDFVTQWVSKNSVFASEDVVFDAETNSWKQQKRDRKGRFTKRVSPTTADTSEDVSQYQEMIEPYYKYVDLDKDMDMNPELFSAFLDAAILDEEFPEKLTDPYFYQYLQKVAESVPLEILNQVNEFMEMQMNIGNTSGDRDLEIIGGRGVFIIDILLNIKTGQEMWAAESLVKTSCCCGATEDKPCRCMKEGPMNCSAQEPKCPCYQDLEKNAEDDGYNEAEINLMRYDLVEHELENADYNYLYDVMLYGTTGMDNLSSEEVIQKFQSIFERS
jgi:hypothetical protein